MQLWHYAPTMRDGASSAAGWLALAKSAQPGSQNRTTMISVKVEVFLSAGQALLVVLHVDDDKLKR